MMPTIREQRRLNLQLGKETTNYKGQLIRAKAPQALGDHTACKFKCNLIDEDQRRAICNDYWSLASYELKKTFICNYVITSAPKRRAKFKETEERKRMRNESRVFNLPYRGQQGLVKVRVCLKFFCTTLDISETVVRVALRGKSLISNAYIGKDHRGGRTRGLPQDQIDLILNHFDQFPTHTVYSPTKRKKETVFVDPKMSVSKMYRVFKEHCAVQHPNMKIMSVETYRIVVYENRSFKTAFPAPASEKLTKIKKQKTEKKKKNMIEEGLVPEQGEMHNGEENVNEPVNSTANGVDFDLNYTEPMNNTDVLLNPFMVNTNNYLTM